MNDCEMRYRHLTWDEDRHENKRLYYRKGHGPRVRIRIMPDHPDFKKAYAAAVDGNEWSPEEGVVEKPTVVLVGTFRALSEEYYRSREFLVLDAKTRRVRQGILKLCFDVPIKPGSKLLIGNCPIERFGSSHVETLRDTKADKPEAANSRVKAVRAVLGWAVSKKKITTNCARDVAYFRSSKTGFRTWTDADIEKFNAKFPLGTKARLAMDLMLYTGFRRSDVVRFGPEHVANGQISMWQWKGRKKTPTLIEIPVLPELQASLDAAGDGTVAYIETEFGEPYTDDGFGNWFRRRVKEAGLKECSPHGIRKAGATRAAENGASEKALMSIFGWSDPKMPALYTRAANKKKVARDNMHFMRKNPSPSGIIENSAGISHKKESKINDD